MNKKILKIVFSTVLLAFMGFGIAAAANLDGCNITKYERLPDELGCANGTCLYTSQTTNCGMCCMLNSIYNITDWIFVILMAVSSFMIIYGGFLFTTSSGDSTKTTTARNLILFAAVGIVVALFARAVPPAVQMIMGA